MSAWGRRCLWSADRHPYVALDSLDLAGMLSPRPAATTFRVKSGRPSRRGTSHWSQWRQDDPAPCDYGLRRYLLEK
jgi:hypothetical protein